MQQPVIIGSELVLKTISDCEADLLRRLVNANTDHEALLALKGEAVALHNLRNKFRGNVASPRNHT